MAHCIKWFHGQYLARRFGYFIAIIVNAIMIYVANNLMNWNIPFLNEGYQQALWAINLSLGVSIFINFTFLFFDPAWYRNLMQAIANIFSAVSVFVFRSVFPIDVPENVASVVNIALMALFGLLLLTVVIELANAIRNYRRFSS